MADEHIPVPRVTLAADQTPFRVPDEIEAAIDFHERRWVRLEMLGYLAAAELHHRAWTALLAEVRE